MIVLAVMCSALASGELAAVPSYKEISERIASNRERIRSMQVVVTLWRPLEKGVLKKELYFDADAIRWRVDSSGLQIASGIPSVADDIAFATKVGVTGGFVYSFSPLVPRLVARKNTLSREISEKGIKPFPDPRNAGLKPGPQGDTGMPFEKGGLRLPVDATTISCPHGDHVSVTRAPWKGEDCWKVEWVRPFNGKDRFVNRYFVAPGKDYSVVFLEVTNFEGNDRAPFLTFSVESDIVLHKESQMWFPAKVLFTGVIKGKKSKEETAEFRVVSINKPIPESVFMFEGMGVPAGHIVVDLTDDAAPSKVWDGERIVDVRFTAPLGTTEQRSDVGRRIMIGLSILFLLTFVILSIRRSVRNRRATGPKASSK